MSPRAKLNQVKFKVRYNALLLRQFSVADMIRVTGLNPESVRTELQRMKHEGLLSVEPYPEKHEKRGGHPSLYRLTDDPEIRIALSKNIEVFYPMLPSSDQPTSRYYLSAKKLIDQAQTADDLRRRQMLSDAEHDLEIAEQAEGSSLASDSIKAYLQYEYARLAYLRGKHEMAQELFDVLDQYFASVNNAIMTLKVLEYRLCLMAWAHQRELGTRSNMRADALARCLLTAIQEVSYETDSPLALFLIDLVGELSQTTEDKINAIASERAAELNKRGIDAIEMKVDSLFLKYASREQGVALPRRETEKIPSADYFGPKFKDRDANRDRARLKRTRND